MNKMTEIAWVIIFFVIMLISMSGSMFVAAAYLTPLVLQTANCAPRDSLGSVIEIAFLFGGMFFGISMALLILALLTRNFLDVKMYGKWLQQYNSGKLNLPKHKQLIVEYVFNIMAPRGYETVHSNKSPNKSD